MESHTRLVRHQRQTSLSSNSALSRTSDQSSVTSSPQRRRISLSSNNTSLGVNTASTRSHFSNDSSTFIQRNPRYSSLWLQKCLLPKRLEASTLNASAQDALRPDCYPYPSMADSVGKFYLLTQPTLIGGPPLDAWFRLLDCPQHLQ